ncbi:hypothetical protein F4813DRAFT_395780 [Daldinia decipiens]|uniref:uncharacterized protein n=1 Tax=Daldinia decipiens TaxID=326647 RepID=UPI0020C59766|nr:uncharacterized protein F4813DRAFT_395780 [Daldinia decipiens]KAI1658489.1 hypothetical protein F4813DRAFT_395780 [Daldinia decipiens]
MASGSTTMSRARLYLTDPGGPKGSDVEDPMEEESPCQLSIERLFENLPNPTSNDRYGDQEQDRQYKRALRLFLEEETGPAEHDNECKQLKSVASKVLKSKNVHGVRVAFIDGIAPMIIDLSKYDAESAKSRYLAHCKWILQGRKDHDAYDGNLSDPDPDEDSDVEYSQLPKQLTTQTKCAYCHREGRQFCCIDCVVITSSRETIGTGYCRRRCEVLDKDDHRLICFWRQRFARSVRLMQTILLTMEYHQTTLSLEGSYERDGMIFLKEKSRHFRAMSGETVTCEFNDQFVEERHQKAALQDQYLPDLPFMMLSSTQEWLWKGLIENIEQYTILVKNAHRPIVRHTIHNTIESSMLRPHTVFCVTLRSGEKFAVDYAGARFGWVETLSHWEHFAAHRLKRVIRRSFPGAWERDPATMIPAYLPEKKKAYLHTIFLRMALSETHRFLQLEYPDISFDTALSVLITDSVWKGVASNLVENTLTIFDEGNMRELIVQCDIKARTYLNDNFEEWVESHDKDRERLQNVWFNENQLTWIKTHIPDNMEALKKVWNDWISSRGVHFKDTVPSPMEIENGATVFEG